MSQDVLSNLDQTFPDLAKLRDAADDSEQRRVEAVQLDVIDLVAWGPGSYTDSSEYSCFSPGSIALVLGRSGSSIFDKLHNDLKNTGSFDYKIVQVALDKYKERKVVSLGEAVEAMKKQATIVDLIGGRFTLASNLFVPEEMGVVFVPMPYNGGSLEGVEFTLIKRSRADLATDLKAFIVRCAPELTEAEKAALALLPPDANDLNVGRAAMCYAITGVTVVLVVIAATYACPGSAPRVALTDDEITQLGPELTARKLLQLRRAALERRI